MTSTLHLVCKANAGLRCIDRERAIYASESWLLTDQEIADLVGGRVFLHETKSRPSHFGGSLIEARPVDLSETGARRRYTLFLQSRSDCKNVPWNKLGSNHAMAWSSGVIAGD